MPGYIETFRGSVLPWECDQMGHMNVQFYTAKVSQSVCHLRAAFGLTPSAIRRDGRSMVALTNHIRYRRELRSGAILFIRSLVLGVGERTIDFVCEVVDADSGEVSATYDIRCGHFDLAARRLLPWSGEMRSRIGALVGRREQEPRPPSTGAGTVLPPGGRTVAPFETGRSTVQQWEVDEVGHLSAHFYTGRVADALGHVKSRVGMDWATMQRQGWGSAALEYRVRYLKELKAGDLIVVRSGIVEAGERTLRYGHRLYNAETETLSCTMEAVSILFDMNARRAVPLPAELRVRAQAWLIDWPAWEERPR